MAFRVFHTKCNKCGTGRNFGKDAFAFTLQSLCDLTVRGIGGEIFDFRLGEGHGIGARQSFYKLGTGILISLLGELAHGDYLDFQHVSAMPFT